MRVTTDFAELPAGITALSRLTDLVVGRVSVDSLQQRHRRPLDVRALGTCLASLRYAGCHFLFARY